MKTNFKILFSYLLLIFTSVLLLGFYHSIHISYGEAEMNNHNFKGKITFYKNDFMLALKNSNGSELTDFTNQDYEKIKRKYLSHHLAAYENGQKLNLKIITNNEDENSIWFVFKFSSSKPIQQIKFKNTVLFKEYSDQLNLLNINTEKGESSFTFSSSNSEVVIKN